MFLSNTIAFAPKTSEQRRYPLSHPLNDIQEADLVLDTAEAWHVLLCWEKATKKMCNSILLSDSFSTFYDIINAELRKNVFE